MLSVTVEELVEACQKLISKHERYAREMRRDDVRRSRRVSLPHQAVIQRPTYWAVHDSFDPYKVRSNARAIVRAVNLALASGTYSPRSPIAHEVPKSGGRVRTVSIFPIIDSVISRNIYRSLTEKNRALLSARSYAYRDDLSTHDAIQYIASEFNTVDRVYVAEYDFTAYFDSISHTYLRNTLQRNRFLITNAEQRVLEQFMTIASQDESTYVPTRIDNQSGFGIPQGTSISLFLANAAAWDLDRALERIGVSFVRYADDTLIWSRSYDQISDAANILKRESASIGADLNVSKSKGIRLFTAPGEPAEIDSTEQVNFVGYRFMRGKIGLRDEVQTRIKARIQHLVWVNLLEPIHAGTFNRARVAPNFDRDYLVLLLQLRRYLYGNFSETKVRELEKGAVKRIRYPGVMAYFPLIDDLDQLRAFDGWLVSTLDMALKKRHALLAKQGIHGLPVPHGLLPSELISATSRTSQGDKVDLRIPSTARFSSILLRAAIAYGANSIARGTGANEYQYSMQERA